MSVFVIGHAVDIAKYLLKYIDIRTRINLHCVCKYWRNVSKTYMGDRSSWGNRIDLSTVPGVTHSQLYSFGCFDPCHNLLEIKIAPHMDLGLFDEISENWYKKKKEPTWRPGTEPTRKSGTEPSADKLDNKSQKDGIKAQENEQKKREGKENNEATAEYDTTEIFHPKSEPKSEPKSAQIKKNGMDKEDRRWYQCVKTLDVSESARLTNHFFEHAVFARLKDLTKLKVSSLYLSALPIHFTFLTKISALTQTDKIDKTEETDETDETDETYQIDQTDQTEPAEQTEVIKPTKGPKGPFLNLLSFEALNFCRGIDIQILISYFPNLVHIAFEQCNFELESQILVLGTLPNLASLKLSKFAKNKYKNIFIGHAFCHKNNVNDSKLPTRALLSPRINRNSQTPKSTENKGNQLKKLELTDFGFICKKQIEKPPYDYYFPNLKVLILKTLDNCTTKDVKNYKTERENQDYLQKKMWQTSFGADFWHILTPSITPALSNLTIGSSYLKDSDFSKFNIPTLNELVLLDNCVQVTCNFHVHLNRALKLNSPLRESLIKKQSLKIYVPYKRRPEALEGSLKSHNITIIHHL